MKVLFSGTNGGEVYACEEMIDGATVVMLEMISIGQTTTIRRNRIN